MKNAALVLALFSTAVFAQPHTYPKTTKHKTNMTGLADNDGRYIKVEIIENNVFQGSYQICANNFIYLETTQSDKMTEPYNMQHSLKVSICQDNTFSECQEIGYDNYITAPNKKGYLENDITDFSFDISTIKDSFKSCEPDFEMENDITTKGLQIRQFYVFK